MAYDDHTEFPRGTFHNTLAADREVASGAIRVGGIVVANTSATVSTVIFKDAADANEIMRWIIPAETTYVLDHGFYAGSGLLVKQVTGAEYVTVHYFTAE
jgi:hypothetical protein